jgi:hypothetical protein
MNGQDSPGILENPPILQIPLLSLPSVRVHWTLDSGIAWKIKCSFNVQKLDYCLEKKKISG